MNDNILMPNNETQGMTSIEAAKAYRDYEYEKQNLLNMDALQRAHLRRMMGFDFRVKFAPNKIHVSSTQTPYVSTYCKLKPGDVENGFVTNEATIDRLVDACMRLKIKHDAEMAKRA